MILENKLGIVDAKELADNEEKLAKLGARELLDSGRLNTIPVGTYESLCEIHKALFGKIYDFAGELRTVNIYKGNFAFALVEGLDSAVKFAEIMPQDTFKDIVAKFVQMNIAHPFREGNGRAMRIWLDVMFASALGKIVDWSKIDRAKFLLAMEHCAMDNSDLVALIKPAMTPDMSRPSFLRGIDASFALEGYCKYRAESL